MKRGHSAIRTCMGCGQKAARETLVRLVVREKELIEDNNKSRPGRGVYCCPEQQCRDRLMQNKRLLRRLLSGGLTRTGVTDE